MENESNEAQLNKIRALLAKAEATDFPEEAETYTAKAMELMAKWGIDQSLLEAKTKTSVIGDRIFKVYAPYAADKLRFFNGIVNALGGRGIWITRARYQANPGYEELHVFATETDLARIDMLFTSLLVQCSSAMNYAVNNHPAGQARPRKFKADFLYGFTVEVGRRLYEAERKAAKEAESKAAEQGMSTALVLVAKKDQVDRRVEERYSDLRSRSSHRSPVGAGYGHGREAGKRADLGGTRMGASSKQSALAG